MVQNSKKQNNNNFVLCFMKELKRKTDLPQTANRNVRGIEKIISFTKHLNYTDTNTTNVIYTICKINCLCKKYHGNLLCHNVDQGDDVDNLRTEFIFLYIFSVFLLLLSLGDKVI